MALNVADDAPVTFEKESNKRKGTAAHTRYEKYKHAANIKDFFALGRSKRDLRFDWSKGLCKVDGQDYETWLENGTRDEAKEADHKEAECAIQDAEARAQNVKLGNMVWQYGV